MTAPYTLYNRVGSGGFVVEAALALAGADVTLVDLDSKPGTVLPASFRAINPWGQVPTLVLADGTTVTECAAILVHLAACHPDRPLGPRPGTVEHARFLRWMVFTSVNVYEPLLHRIYPERYTADPDGRDGVRAAGVARAGAALAQLEAAIDAGPFLLGAQMSVLDLYVAMLHAWFAAPPARPRLDALKALVRDHAVVAPVWRRHLGDR